MHWTLNDLCNKYHQSMVFDGRIEGRTCECLLIFLYTLYTQSTSYQLLISEQCEFLQTQYRSITGFLRFRSGIDECFGLFVVQNSELAISLRHTKLLNNRLQCSSSEYFALKLNVGGGGRHCYRHHHHHHLHHHIYTNFAVNWLAFLLRIYMYACQFKGTHKV